MAWDTLKQLKKFLKKIKTVNQNINFINDDCMNYMANIHDKYYDLAIVDPPYTATIASN